MFIFVRLDSISVSIEPAVHIRLAERLDRLVGMLVVAFVAFEAS